MVLFGAFILPRTGSHPDYALSLLAAAPPRDTTFANQKKALAVLNQQFAIVPDNPGVAHYIIHSCDSPQMAAEGLKAAQLYGEFAPSAPHAAHMPGQFLRGSACGRMT